MPRPSRTLASGLALLIAGAGGSGVCLSLSASAGLAVLIAQTAARAQFREAEVRQAVAKEAEAITVRIEGVGSPGSGVLVQRQDNRYTVLTAWHVVKDQNPGEELAIYTPDGKKHQLEQGSIQQVGDVDLAVLSFSSTNSYAIARLGDSQAIVRGAAIYVAGYPVASIAVPVRLLRFLDAQVLANAQQAIPNGYQLLYASSGQPTLPGMSGGAVLNAQAQLVGIHGRAETDDKHTEQDGIYVKTGTSQAVPIAYYRPQNSGPVPAPPAEAARTAGDLLAQAWQLEGQKGREQELIRLANQSLALQASAEGYYLRAYAKSALGDKQGAIADYNQALAINPRNDSAYYNRGAVKYNPGSKQGACSDFKRAISLGYRSTMAWFQTASAAWCREMP